jgi:translation initiation factor 1
MSNSNTRLVYSTDPKKVKCPRCGEFTPGCACVTQEKIVNPKGLVAKLRIEKAGRGGKVVSVIFDLPRDTNYLKDLTKKLKGQLGTGGTYKDENNAIEIQGDHRPRLREILEKMGFQVKG